MLVKMLQFERAYQSKQYFFYIGMLLFLFLGFKIGSQEFAGSIVNVNAPYQVTYNSSIFTLGSVFIIMFFAISSVLRDVNNDFEQILFSTNITKSHYFISRFLSVFLFSILTFSPFFIGQILGSFSPSLDPNRMAPFHLFTYLLPWMVFAVPNVFICSTIIFSVSLLTKNRVATYTSAVLVYTLYFLCSLIFDSPIMAASKPSAGEGMSIIATLADPFGISAFFKQTLYWTPHQKNMLFIGFNGDVLLNRIFWIGISGFVLLFTYNVFSFRKKEQILTFKWEKKPRSDKQEKSLKEIYSTKDSWSYVSVIPSALNTWKSQWKMFKSTLGFSMKGILKSIPFWVIMLFWVFVVLSSIWSSVIEGGSYNESRYPATFLLIQLIVEPFNFLAPLLIVFYSGELVWAEYEQKFHQIVYSTPHKNSMFFLTKLTALLSIPFLLLTSGFLMAISFQLAMGFYELDLSTYLASYYYYGFPTIFYCFFALFIQTLLPNKYAAMSIVGAILLVFSTSFAQQIGIEHPLLSLGRFPHVFYSDLLGFIFTKSFTFFVIYWGLLGIVFLALSFKLWKRESSITFLDQLRKLKVWSTQEKRIMSVLLILFGLSTSSIFYQTNIVTEYLNREQVLDRMESYERRYIRFDTIDRLIPTDIKLNMDLFPSEQKYEVEANLVLTNLSDHEISEVLITEKVKLSNLSIEGTLPKEYNEQLGTYVFEFPKPIQPQQKLAFSYSLSYQVGLLEPNRSILKNASYIRLPDFSPVLGYWGGMDIDDNSERKKRGLTPKVLEIPSEDHLNADEVTYQRLTYEAIVSTESDEEIITSGNLLAKWTDEGRNYFHYKTHSRITPMIVVMSGNYEQSSEQFADVSFEHYYNEKHRYNLETISQSVEATLDYCGQHFGKYPFSHLRMAETSALHTFGGQAIPGAISMVEDNLYLIDTRYETSFNLVAKRTIHEVAHQWWGHILSPKNVAGSGFFTEGLAKYTEALVLEEEYGLGYIWQLSETASQRYFRGRAYTSVQELPLTQSDGQGYIIYGKHYTVLMGLKALLGEVELNKIIKKLVDEYGFQNKFELTILDFIEAIYESAPNHKTLIEDWFKRIIHYKLVMEEASYQKLSDGRYELTLNIQSSRKQIQNDGSAKQIGIAEPIQVGLFKKHPREVRFEEDIILLKSLDFKQFQTKLTLIVDELPTHVSIDPYGTRVDNNLEDNTIILK